VLAGTFWWQVAWVLEDLDMKTKKISIWRLAFQSRATKGQKERKKEKQSNRTLQDHQSVFGFIVCCSS